MICQLKVLTLSFHLHQGGPLKAFGSPRNAYMAAYWHTQSAACWARSGASGASGRNWQKSEMESNLIAMYYFSPPIDSNILHSHNGGGGGGWYHPPESTTPPRVPVLGEQKAHTRGALVIVIEQKAQNLVRPTACSS